MLPSRRTLPSLRRSADPTDRSILVLGSPRSGTTWLAKLFDSHPDVVYRHEPDEVRPPTPGRDPRTQLRLWIDERSPRVAAKPPIFRKSWLPEPLALLRSGMAGALKAIARLPNREPRIARTPLPDFIPTHRWYDVRPLVKLVHWDASALLRAVPNCRCLFILRHPCGQVASTLTGWRQGRFTDDRPGTIVDPWAVRFAAEHGVAADTFAALPPAAQLAWTWRAFNEPALAELAELPNAQVVIYEELCAQPMAVTRTLFDFVALDWHPQTAGFIDRSTRHEGPADYFAVFRSSDVAAWQWRNRMHPADQYSVRSIVRASPLMRHWADLDE